MEKPSWDRLRLNSDFYLHQLKQPIDVVRISQNGLTLLNDPGPKCPSPTHRGGLLHEMQKITYYSLLLLSFRVTTGVKLKWETLNLSAYFLNTR